jgi:hypothetical protein
LTAKLYKFRDLFEIQKRFTCRKADAANTCPDHPGNDLFGTVMVHIPAGGQISRGHAMLAPDIAPG